MCGLSCYNERMHPVYKFFLLFWAFACPLGAQAQKAVKHIGKALAAQERNFQSVISSHMDRAVLRASQTARLAHHNREAYFNSAKTIPFQGMVTLSDPKRYVPYGADPSFALHNDKIAFPWFETIEKDLLFLRKQQPAIRRVLQVEQVTPSRLYYPDLIPAGARKIYVGEEHHQPAIYRAFEQMVRQYQAAHPQKKIIVLTEFVSDRLLPWQLPGKPVSRWEIKWRRNDKEFAFLSRFLRAGIEVIGLENIAYIQEHEALIAPSENEAHSVYGMQERNAHWRRIISYVADKNPQAVLFIYTGSMHSHYRAPFSLATPSPQNFVFQLESRQLGLDMPFGFVMHQEPFVRATSQTATVLTWKDQTSVFRTRSGFDVAIIFPGENE